MCEPDRTQLTDDIAVNDGSWDEVDDFSIVLYGATLKVDIGNCKAGEVYDVVFNFTEGYVSVDRPSDGENIARKYLSLVIKESE